MQSKLNEILELCIQKSANNVFYSFSYHNLTKYVWIQKFNGGNKLVNFKEYSKPYIMTRDIDKALEYMQNE